MTEGVLNGDVIDGIMMEDKKEVDKVILTGAELGKYFGKETTPREMKDQIIKLLDDWKGQQKEVAKPEKKAARRKSNASSGQLGPRQYAGLCPAPRSSKDILIFPVARFSGSISGKISQGPQPPQAVPKAPLTDFSRLSFQAASDGDIYSFEPSPFPREGAEGLLIQRNSIKICRNGGTKP